MNPGQLTETLCGACGFCCNGLLWGALPLRQEEAARLSALGAPLQDRHGVAISPQPCYFHLPIGCRVYDQRPKTCRAYQCRLLTRVLAGEIGTAAALGRITDAKEQVDALRERMNPRQRAKPFRLFLWEAVEAAQIWGEASSPQGAGFLSAIMTLLRVLDEDFEPQELLADDEPTP